MQARKELRYIQAKASERSLAFLYCESFFDRRGKDGKIRNRHNKDLRKRRDIDRQNARERVWNQPV
jgi:hypothetical protein